MKLSPIKSLFALLLVAALASCGGSSGGSTADAWIGITVDNTATPTKLYLASFNGNSVKTVSIAGGTATSLTTASPAFNGPEGLALVGANLYVVDALNHGVRQVSTVSPFTTTTYAGTLGTSGNSDAQATFNVPRNAVADAAGNLYVTDSGNNTVRMIAAATKAVTTLASGFNNPWGITIDNATPQNLYVTDIGTHSVKKLSQSGGVWSVSTLAGSTAGTSGLPSNANGTAALFNYPLGITTDNTYLYVVDAGNNAIRRIELAAPNAVVLMAGSSAGTAGNSVSTTGPSALLYSPYAITYGGGSVYVTDQDATLIRKISTTAPYPVSTFTLN